MNLQPFVKSVKALPASAWLGFACAWTATELFLHLHSFTLEFLAFGATWAVLDAAMRTMGAIGRKIRERSWNPPTIQGEARVPLRPALPDLDG